MKQITLQMATMILASIQPSGDEQKSLPELKGRRIKSKTYYVAGNTADLPDNGNETIPSQIIKTLGLTNLPTGGQLGKGVYFLCDEIRVLFDTTTADPKAAVWASVAPTVFKNGELIIGQEGQPSLFEASGTDVTNFKASTGNDDDYRGLPAPFLWQPQKQLSSKLMYTGALPATTSYKIEYRGFEIFTA